MSPSSPMGKYGILHIVNRKNNSPAYSYPVDNEHTTFGRDDGCDIRLLYGWVSGFHCKLFFQNAKAFLTVYGLNGIIVDGCHIARNPDADGESSETTIPIMNNSQIEIYRKRFVFEYPSKELRAKARAEPATVKPRRTLRLSMIQSAQVFTPSKPSSAQTPKSHRRRRSETLAEQLQSPIKPFSPARPLPAANMGHEILSAADEEREVTLVGARGAQSVVVLEEEKDLVVVEAVGEDSDDEDLSDEEEIIKDKENENPFDVGRSPAQPSSDPSAAPSTSPAAGRSTPGMVPRRAFTSPYAPSRPSLHRSSASVPAPTPPPAPVMTPPQPVRTPARRARFSLHKAVLLRSAQRQLIERERLNQLQARETTIFDEESDAEMTDMEPEFVEEPDSEPSEIAADPKLDVHLATEVKQLSVQDVDAEEEDAVEAVVSPARMRTNRDANGSFSDDSERSMSEGDVSVAESEESDISEEHEPEDNGTPLGARIQNSISSLGSFLPNLLRSPAKVTEDTEEEEDIVDQVASKNDATGPAVVKVEPEEEEDAHEVLRFGSDSDNEEELDDKPVTSGQPADMPEPEEPSASEEEDIHTPDEFEATQVDGRVVKNEPVDDFEDKETVESTPAQPRRLNVFMTPQVARPNFARPAAGRKSVAVATPGSAVGDVSWLPGRVPVSTQHVDSDEEEEEEELEEQAVLEEVPAMSEDVKQHISEIGLEEKAARRQSALAVLAAGPRQLPNRRQSVAPNLAKSEPLDPNNRRMTLAATALAPIPGTPQHASTLAPSSETALADDSSDEETPPEKPLDTLRKKIDYMRRQSMHRAARESPIGPLFGDMPSETTLSGTKLEDSEEIEVTKSEEAEGLEESEKEQEESEVEIEAEVEEDEEQGVTQSEAETETEAEEAAVPEPSDAESEAISEQDDESGDVTVVGPITTGPSTPALQGVRVLFRAAEVKGLGTQTPAGLDGMLDMFGPEFEPEPEAEPVVEAETKPTRSRTKSANPTRLKPPAATGMARARSAQTAAEATRSAKAAEPAASRVATRSLREPTKLPSRVQTPVEEPEPSTARTSATRKPAATVSVVLPRRTKVVKEEPSAKIVEEPAPVESKIKAPAKRITRTASTASSTTESKRMTRTSSSASTNSRVSRAAGRTTPIVPEEPTKPAARSTRAKVTATSGLPARSKTSAPPTRVTTPVDAADDDQDPMDIMTMPESPTKRSTRAKVVKAEPEEDEVAHATRSRTKSGESEAAKGKRVTSRRVASKSTEENKENTAVEVSEVETESKVKPSGLPTKSTRKTATTTSKPAAPSKIAVKAEPAATSTTARALRTRARK